MTELNIEWFDGAEAYLDETCAGAAFDAPFRSFRPIARVILDGRRDGTNQIKQLIDPRLNELNSFCAISGVSGRWGGTTELAQVYLAGAPSGNGLTWYYDLRSGQADIRATIQVTGFR